ncbi:putative DNA primase large subunit [Gracilariopsis chorda]|uniref:Putative DNA primase large subunit n=1 Tax=Gracilariopsis chorda TaxID=448386 RepID=A0A2V3IK34_9FLOR|nr:putative DNA primase large subunit [Gracilariopsis chorda]|eukprot:PXF42403.1 putative DNA primase large subunit [Gracilariopsis chorda]
MEVLRASTNALPDAVVAPQNQPKSSYAPLYTSSSLGAVYFDLEELEAIAIKRLKVLKAAEKARSSLQLGAQRIGHGIDTIRTAVRVAEKTHGLHIPPVGNRERDDMILRDEASHFLVRMALCSDHECRNWLLQTEYDLFTTRLHGTGVDFALKAIEKANGPVVKRVPPAEMEKFRLELEAVTRGPNRQRNEPGTKYYKIAFEEVPALVRHRKVFLHQGFAFVPETSILDVVAAQFRSLLSAGLSTAMKYGTIAERDERMRPILESIRQHFVADEESKKSFDPSASIERISLKELEASLPAMPLCMFNMMTKLRQNHHLRHAARIQLGVFLKACGLSMDESILFWRTEFGKGSITSEKFDKQYAYNIRHQYGREGKRRNLPAFNCMKVINDRPGPGEHNGCPYREFEESRLKSALRALGADPNAISGIASKAKEGNFQAACGMCFASSQPGTHPISEYGLPEFIPDHPNAYFIEARRRRFGPTPEALPVDDDIDDEDLLMATEAIELQHSASSTPVRPVNERQDAEATEKNEARVSKNDAGNPRHSNGDPVNKIEPETRMRSKTAVETNEERNPEPMETEQPPSPSEKQEEPSDRRHSQ